MKESIVIANYYGECCPKAHILVARVKAQSLDAAGARLVEHIRDTEGNEPGEVLAFGGTDEIPTLEEIREDLEAP